MGLQRTGMRLQLFGDIDWNKAEYISTSLFQAYDTGLEKIDLTIASPGGTVEAALSIYQELRLWLNSHSDHVLVTRVSGMAASAATVVLQAGSERQINSGASLVVHNSWRSVQGKLTAPELQSAADLAAHQSESMFRVLRLRAGRKFDVLQTLRDDNWIMNADEAKENNLVDTILEIPSWR